jgi:hypothetical protein
MSVKTKKAPEVSGPPALPAAAPTVPPPAAAPPPAPAAEEAPRVGDWIAFLVWSGCALLLAALLLKDLLR